MIYWFVVLGAPIILGALVFLSVWLLAHMNTIFGFIKEGQGAFKMSGESFEKIHISFHGFCIKESENSRTGKKFLEIAEGEPASEGFLLDWLRKEFGIYYFGLYPFKRRLTYLFRWSEWLEKSESGKLVEEIVRRELPTNFFYAQTFPYALVLESAETGGVRSDDGKSEIAGNLSIDMAIVLLVRIVRPQVAILQTENWFDSLGATVINQARLYVGSRTFDELRSQKEGTGSSTGGNTVVDEFCEHIMRLNEHAPIGDHKDDSIIDAYGVKIIGAQILRIDIAGDNDGSLAKAVTEAYRKQQEAIGMKEIAEAKAFEIEATGQATANAIKAAGDARAHATRAQADAVQKSGEAGRFVMHQNTIGEAGKGGNTVIFTRNREDEDLSRLIVPHQLDRQRGASNATDKKAA